MCISKHVNESGEDIDPRFLAVMNMRLFLEKAPFRHSSVCERNHFLSESQKNFVLLTAEISVRKQVAAFLGRNEYQLHYTNKVIQVKDNDNPGYLSSD